MPLSVQSNIMTEVHQPVWSNAYLTVKHGNIAWIWRHSQGTYEDSEHSSFPLKGRTSGA